MIKFHEFIMTVQGKRFWYFNELRKEFQFYRKIALTQSAENRTK